MTSTTSIAALRRNQQTYSPPAVARPGILTFISQATLGCGFGYYIMSVGYALLINDPNSFMFIFVVPMLLFVGTVIGAPVGLIIWLFARSSDQALSRTYRVTIAVLLLAIGCFAFLLFLFGEVPTSQQQLALLVVIFVTGVTIGSFTGSSLQPGRELIRGGDAVRILPKILAGFTGLLLRVLVVHLFLASVIAALAMLQAYFNHEPYPEQLDPLWIAAAFAHFALAAIVLFARMKFQVLAVLTAVANAPVVASFWMFPEMAVELRYAVFGYLIVWAIFLLARWRQTDAALAVLKNEFRYYLID